MTPKDGRSHGVARVWLVVLCLIVAAATFAIASTAFARFDQFGGGATVYAPYTAPAEIPYAPYTAGPVVREQKAEPYAPYTAGPVVGSKVPYAPYTAGPIVREKTVDRIGQYLRQ